MRIVALGGGHGLARTLEAFVALGHRPTAVVSVADNGGSTGRLRVDRAIPALGDLRHALQVLAGDERDRAWLAHRFGLGDLAGHAAGNLVLLALLESGMGLVDALAHLGHQVGALGRVLPCTTANVHLYARDHGEQLIGQVAVQNRYYAGPLEALWLDPADAPACPEAVDAIANADIITLGPGSLLTSLAPVLLVDAIAKAVVASSAFKLIIANTTTQPGETDGMDLGVQCGVLLDLLPGCAPIDVLVHHGPFLGGPGMGLGTRINDARINRVHIHDVAVRPHEGVGTGHDATRLAQALTQILPGHLPNQAEPVSHGS